MGENYLKKYYLDDHKLAQRARLEFYRALSTGRMIAFTGSMATQAFGYGSWEQLRMTFSALAGDVAASLKAKNATDDATIAYIKERISDFEKRSAGAQWSTPVGMSLIEEALDRWKGAPPVQTAAGQPWPRDQVETARETLRLALARRFRKPLQDWHLNRDLPTSPRIDGTKDFDDRFNVPRALWHDLGIRRFATPSYDFEIERVAMLADKAFGDPNPAPPFETLATLRGANNENFSWDLGSGRIRRVLADGWAIESDLLNRERIDRMIEFAVGTDDVDGHVMHLHGRACNWRSMIASQTDYDNLYRRNDLSRAPFEFAKRMMMGGNPLLFVGLGMSEAELNQEMQEFISNNPYQRVAPTFLLWSVRPGEMDEERIAAMRVDYLRRLGVLTIFDRDLGDVAPQIDGYQTSKKRYDEDAFKPSRHAFGATPNSTTLAGRKDEIDRADFSNREDLYDLKAGVDRLREGLDDDASPFKNPTIRERHIGDRWRSMRGRMLPPPARDEGEQPDEPIVLWRTDHGDTQTLSPKLAALAAKASEVRILCVVGSQGCGKGHAALSLATHADQLGVERNSDCMLINGGFCYDTDTILDGVARFFQKSMGEPPATQPDAPPVESRSRFFRKLKLGVDRDGRPEAVVIINGMDRFFDLAGEPLSAELDELLHLASAGGKPTVKKGSSATSAQPRVRWILFGTERIRKHMTKIGAHVVDFGWFAEPPQGGPQGEEMVPGRYLHDVWQVLRKAGVKKSTALQASLDRYNANRTGRISGDSTDLRRAFFGVLLDEITLHKVLNDDEAAGSVDTATVREILKALAFIGLPVEEDVLKLMPGLIERADFGVALKRLVAKKLVLKLEGYRPPSGASAKTLDRFALHRSLLTELRYRFGIPLSEAKLSTAFNMSLYIAQPIDGDIPDTDIHDDLGAAIDQLIGSYKLADPSPLPDLRLGPIKLDALTYEKLLQATSDGCGSSKRQADANEIQRLCSARHARALRTALALVRSYYSTTGLLTLDSGDRLIREGRDGVLLEHAERLDDLIDAYGKMSLARQHFCKALTKELPHASKEDIDEFLHRLTGDVEPFYADELVWLHNERGVVRLAMGDLYEARRSFDQALDVNMKWVEPDDRAHNWRRIRLNQLTVDLEMGEISLAERKCEELIQVTRYPERLRMGAPEDLANRAETEGEDKRKLLREDELAIAIATGYHGWCLHLRGQVDRALEKYEEACNQLSQLVEVRAQAYFERLHANALGSARKHRKRIETLERALYLAQSAVQMDIVHRLQITLADTYLFGVSPAEPQQRQRAHRYMEEAMTYALHANVHRVRCEASMVTARARLGISDFDGALRYATDAMMIATRYGMELRKISLRALIAKIMAARGHPVTAEHLARTCIKMATRQRYQTAIDDAAQVILDIPRVSAAISTSDKSGLRNF